MVELNNCIVSLKKTILTLVTLCGQQIMVTTESQNIHFKLKYTSHDQPKPCHVFVYMMLKIWLWW